MIILVKRGSLAAALLVEICKFFLISVLLINGSCEGRDRNELTKSVEFKKEASIEYETYLEDPLNLLEFGII